MALLRKEVQDGVAGIVFTPHFHYERISVEDFTAKRRAAFLQVAKAAKETGLPLVLEDVNITIGEGEFVAVLGHNGSGKSTFAKHCNAVLLPRTGTVTVDGMNTKDEDKLFEIRQCAGMVFQNPDNQIVATVVEEDVAFAPENMGVEPAEIRRRVDEALKAVGMYEYRESAPHQLSGGQKQRVAIAGIIAMQPRCIVLDEPTAMLDPIGRSEVLRTIRDLNRKKGVTVVLITHHMDEAAQADRLVVMTKGRVIADGPPRQVFQDVEGLRSVGLDLTPGGINFVDSLPGQNQPVATPLLQVKPDLAQARSAMEAVQQQIRAGLYNDLFRLILEGRSKVTASEIAAREEEKLLLIGPVLERLHDELLIPLIDRTFRLMLALDMLPPCPPELSGRHLKVEFVSLLAQAQKLVGISATDQYLALTLKAASVWPEALDSVDVDNLLDNYAQSLGLPANLTRPREERARLRAGREEARQTEQQLTLLQKAADLGHTLADSDLTVEGEKSSVLQVLANLAAGAAPALRPQQTSGTTPPPEGGHDAR